MKFDAIILSVSAYVGLDVPTIACYSNPWLAWERFCEALNENRGVAIYPVGGPYIHTSIYVDVRDDSCYQIPTATPLVSRSETVKITPYVKKLLEVSKK